MDSMHWANSADSFVKGPAHHLSPVCLLVHMSFDFSVEQIDLKLNREFVHAKKEAVRT